MTSPAGQRDASSWLERVAAGYRARRGHAVHVPFDAFQISSLLLLLALVVHPPAETHWLARAALALGLVFPMVSRRSATFWVVAFVLFFSGPLERGWLALDNHEVLQLYWLGSFAVSRFADRPDRVLADVARWLLALVFVFATMWKLLAPDFSDGTAVAYLFGVEERMADTAVAMNLQGPEVTEQNRANLATWLDPTEVPKPVRLVIAETVDRLAPALAWATILIELIVALAFLLPLPQGRRWWRDVALIGFVLLTYPLMPVLPFAWVLLSLGAMQSEVADRLRPPVYLGVFLVVTFVYGLRQWTLLPFLEMVL